LTKVPRAMSLEEITRMQDEFVVAAKRSLAAGCEWLELHAAHGYLMHEFLSPISNRRTDRYGGSFENRIRLLPPPSICCGIAIQSMDCSSCSGLRAWASSRS
jgi:2,4-dienoyl-CoA reductase-like NADH-dependent reductase (Old Yellow Enzyme family)